jgi:ABC-type Zn uptake system ZnuABC Zn-binding protein ZnuA
MPGHSEYFRKNLKEFQIQIDETVFGKELVRLMGGSLLTKLANSGQLVSFLSSKKYQGKDMIDFLGGWLKEGMVFRDKKIVSFHRNWVYFERLFGIEVIGHVEPKPGIPPSPKHVEELVRDMKENNVRLLLAANYFDEEKVKNICEKVGARAVIVPMFVEGAPNTENVFKLVDYWVQNMKSAFDQHK